MIMSDIIVLSGVSLIGRVPCDSDKNQRGRA